MQKAAFAHKSPTRGGRIERGKWGKQMWGGPEHESSLNTFLVEKCVQGGKTKETRAGQAIERYGHTKRSTQKTATKISKQTDPAFGGVSKRIEDRGSPSNRQKRSETGPGISRSISTHSAE